MHNNVSARQARVISLLSRVSSVPPSIAHA